MSQQHAQIIYLSHGGGPLPLLGDPGHHAMVEFMKSLPSKIRKPDAILVISAHWEERKVTLLGAEHPTLLFDYYGFPPETYTLTYPAPNDTTLVKKITTLLANNNIPSDIDMKRGFDHGTFIPLKLMYPNADIPTLQLSLLHNLDPVEHIVLGNALRGLLEDNILIIGSGFSFHNQRAFFKQVIDAPDPDNEAFQNWLIDTCTDAHTQSEREQLLIDWEQAPSARYCHPREEHLLPLHVCVGITEHPAKLVFNDRILSKRSVAFLWQ
ncbi:MAG: DODA-type extradiol aromatic ring-opening family dioxygenase [Minisyncoccota bacterium]